MHQLSRLSDLMTAGWVTVLCSDLYRLPRALGKLLWSLRNQGFERGLLVRTEEMILEQKMRKDLHRNISNNLTFSWIEYVYEFMWEIRNTHSGVTKYCW